MAILKLDLGIGAGFGTAVDQLKRISENTAKVFFDTDRLSKAAKQLETSFKGFGLGAIAALGGIAALAPSLAGDLANMEVAIFQAADAIGKSLKPEFDILTQAMQGFASFLQSNPWAAQLTGGALLAGAAIYGLGLVCGIANTALGLIGGTVTILTDGLALLDGVTAGAVTEFFLLGAGVLFALAPLILFGVFCTVAYYALSQFSNKQQETVNSEFWHLILDWLPGGHEMAGVLGFLNDGLDRFLNYLTGTGIGDAITNLTGVKGALETIHNVLATIGVLPGGASGSDWASGFMDTLPGGTYTREAAGAVINAGQGAVSGATSIVIQVLDQNGQKRDTLVAKQTQSGVTT